MARPAALRSVLALLVLLAGLVAPPPAAAQPAPEVAAAIRQSVVKVRAFVAGEARTARTLGTEREGTGIVIDSDGLIVTIGYVILEAMGRRSPTIAAAPCGRRSSATTPTPASACCARPSRSTSDRLRSAAPRGWRRASGSASSPPGRTVRSPRSSCSGASSPAIGSISWKKRCSCRRRIRAGPAPGSSPPTGGWRPSARCSSARSRPACRCPAT